MIFDFRNFLCCHRCDVKYYSCSGAKRDSGFAACIDTVYALNINKLQKTRHWHHFKVGCKFILMPGNKSIEYGNCSKDNYDGKYQLKIDIYSANRFPHIRYHLLFGSGKEVFEWLQEV